MTRSSKHKVKRVKINKLSSELFELSKRSASETIKQKWITFNEVSKLLKELKQYETEFKPPKRDENWPAFLNWAKKNGANLDAVEVLKLQDGEYTLTANKDLKEGEVFLEIPQDLVLNKNQIEKSDLKDLVKSDLLLKAMTNVQLSLILLWEYYQGDSFWKPYIDILPASYHNVLYFTVEEVYALRGSSAFEAGMDHCFSIARQYAHLNKLLNDPSRHLNTLKEHFSYNAYRWAASAVMSRANNFELEKMASTNRGLSLIPVFDLCNHMKGSLSTAFEPEKGIIKSMTMEDVAAGKELYIFYGPRANYHLLIHSGFIYEDSDDDFYPLKLGIGSNDALRDIRSRLCDKFKILSHNHSYHVKPCEIDPCLFKLVCILSMNKEECEQWLQESEEANILKHEPLVKKGLNYLITRFQILLHGYPEEGGHMASGDQSLHSRLANQFLMIEKKLIQRILDNFNTINKDSNSLHTTLTSLYIED